LQVRNPIRIIEALKTLIQLLIAWVVLMGYWPMSPEQQLLTISLAIAGVNLAGTFWETNETTPLAAPKDESGEPLVRAVDGMPTEAQTRSMAKR
jgi:hypothetical protein